ncbi:hypothetical protein AAZV13_12G132100 [Glycine max]
MPVLHVKHQLPRTSVCFFPFSSFPRLSGLCFSLSATHAMVDSSQLLEAASDFAHYTGAHSDDSARDFLNRFPLPVIFSALQTQFDVPGLENTLVTCLERLFNTKLGASLIPQYMPFVQVGLQADSQAVRSLACKTVTCLIENLDNDHKVAASVRLIKDFNMYPLLLDCFIKGNNQHKNTEKGVEGRSLEYKEPWDLRSNPFQGGGDDAILPPRVLDRRLQETWARATKEGHRVLMNLRVDF